MKKVSLTISERVKAIEILNQYKGDLNKLSVVLEDIKKVNISEDEWKKAKGTETSRDDKGNFTINWSDKDGGEKEIELDGITAEYLVGKISETGKDGGFSVSDSLIGALISLNNKLTTLSQKIEK